jgi:hypothetical protein
MWQLTTSLAQARRDNNADDARQCREEIGSIERDTKQVALANHCHDVLAVDAGLNVAIPVRFLGVTRL